MSDQVIYAAGGGGGGTLGGKFVQVDLQPPQPFTSEVFQRLDRLGEALSDGHSALCSLGDRVLGSLPRAIGEGANNKPNGSGAEIIARLDSLIAMAVDIRGEANRLNSGI